MSESSDVRALKPWRGANEFNKLASARRPSRSMQFQLLNLSNSPFTGSPIEFGKREISSVVKKRLSLYRWEKHHD
jgi:hypothetical protein